MNALTSIRQLWSSPASALPKETVPGAGSAIPTAELRDLNAAQVGGAEGIGKSEGSSFSGMLNQMVQDVNAKQGVATQALQDLQSGQNVSLHQAMIAMEEANVSFQLMVEVRNKLLESYQELMRMQV